MQHKLIRQLLTLFFSQKDSYAHRTGLSRRSFQRTLFIIITLLSLTVPGIGCQGQKNSLQVRENFGQFMNELFIQDVQEDSLSLNYTLAKPENYGIEETDTTLGEYSIDRINQNLASEENRLSHLTSYDYNALTSEQQLTYDIVLKYLRSELTLGTYDYYYECLGPTTGIQAQLPILLAEYSFYDKEDINTYLKLLPSIYDYFLSITEYEKEKSRQGLFMKDEVANRIIKQCEAFIVNPADNFLITHFNEKIDSDKTLSKKEAAAYKANNTEIVINDVIPAYRLLVDCLKELLKTGTNDGGLYYYPQGKSYYKCLAQYKTGSGRTMDEMIQLLCNAMELNITKITSLTLSDSDLIDKYLAFSSFPLTDPDEILMDLKKDMKEDFPDSVPVNCEIKYVPASLSDYLSPAMYLMPPIDDYKNNEIYINGKDKDTLSMIYTTIAHEGYPGHLYQNIYFRSKNPDPYRNLMNFTGYDEGWATYVEFYSYRFSGIDQNLAEFLKANNIVILCLYARTDIGIHYEGWNKKTAVKYIHNFIGDTETAVAIYNTLLEEPAVYLPYAVGYLEIMDLKEKAENTLGDAFCVKDFHRFLLDIGPAQFDIIENRMNDWISACQK